MTFDFFGSYHLCPGDFYRRLLMTGSMQAFHVLPGTAGDAEQRRH